MRHLLLIGTLVAAVSVMGLFANEAQADVGAVYFDATRPNGSCSVHGDSGTLATVTDKPYPSPPVANAFLCTINCGSDLDCWMQGSIFLHFDTDVPPELEYNYVYAAKTAREPYICEYFDDELSDCDPWQSGNFGSKNTGPLPDGVSVEVYGMHCFDFNEDGAVSGLDLTPTINCFGASKTGTWGSCYHADHNVDEYVTGADIYAVLGQFNLTCTDFTWPPE